MTDVNITTTQNTVTVTEGEAITVTVATQGPRGPQGEAGSDFQLTDTAKVDKSIVYYDSASSSYKADATWTVETLVDGSNF